MYLETIKVKQLKNIKVLTSMTQLIPSSKIYNRK
uniref:Uncharacterized protein n=1 Tax=Arundo donax TaxID=35708 RepID=A0A0A9E0V6_ARUDO